MTEANLATALLGGGCFWCVEAVLEPLIGVTDVQSGYAGGAKPNPSYDSVCSGRTGHAEVVKVTYDPAQISFREILEVFFVTHDPTTLNRQGADEGTQYRSVVYYDNEQQLQTIREVIGQMQQIYPNPIVTEVSPATTFYPAEEYHQDYYRRNPWQGYCFAIITPKVTKLRQKFAARLKPE